MSARRLSWRDLARLWQAHLPSAPPLLAVSRRPLRQLAPILRGGVAQCLFSPILLTVSRPIARIAAMALDSSGSPERPTWLTSAALVRVQTWATRLRFVLAVPLMVIVVLFADREPMWPGVVLALSGEAVQLWASAHLRKNVEVAMSGPYAWVRNPMYLGRFLVGLGLAFFTWRWFLIVPYVVVFAVYAQARVLGEEARLRHLFGEDYAAYGAAVRRWLPLPPRRRFSQARWSWACVFRNHELRVAGAVIAGMLLLKLRMAAFGPLWR